MLANGTVTYPWSEVTAVAVHASLLPPDDQRMVGMDISHVSGEYLDVSDWSTGSTRRGRLAARSGFELPDLSVLQPTDGFVEIYRADR